jgi:hypothetical protein
MWCVSKEGYYLYMRGVEIITAATMLRIINYLIWGDLKGILAKSISLACYNTIYLVNSFFHSIGIMQFTTLCY